MLRVAQTLHFFRISILAFMSVFVAACADVIDLPEATDPDIVQNPPLLIESDIEGIGALFIGTYGCQESQDLSLLNFQPDLLLEDSECIENKATGSNPSQLFDLEGNAFAYLDTEYEVAQQDEYFVFASGSSVAYVDLRQNSAKGLVSLPGPVCRIMPAKKYHREVSGVNEEWHVVDDVFVYVEISIGGVGCTDAEGFKSYVKLPLNYDAFAGDFETCATEEDGKSTDLGCKTRLLPAVSAAQALSYMVRGYVLDESTDTPNDYRMAYGYIGWGADERKLKFWDSDGSILWERPFDVEESPGLSSDEQFIVNVTHLDDVFYTLQLGRDIYLFEGQSLFDLASVNSVLADKIYQLDSADRVSVAKIANDLDDLVLYDKGKFFHKAFKDSYIPPLTTYSYVFTSSLDSELESFNDEFVFSQFDLTDCQFSDLPLECEEANDPLSLTWNLVTDCDALLGCSLAPTGYDDVSNDVVFRGYVPYFNKYMRGLDFNFYGDRLLVVLRLSERDVLVLYDFKEATSSPRGDREQLLLGGRLKQSLAEAHVINDGLHISSIVPTASSSNRCYKGYLEVACKLGVTDEGGSNECTGFDLAAGACRVGKIKYESRALYCSAADVTNDICIDTNQINPKTLQVESDTQDAKWLPVISIDDTNGLQRDMRVLVSEDRQFSSNNPSRSYTKEEGVLGNPEMFKLTASGSRTLSSVSEGQLQGTIESVPGAMVLRDNKGAVSVTAEEFVGGISVRQQDELYINEDMDVIVRVTGSRKTQ